MNTKAQTRLGSPIGEDMASEKTRKLQYSHGRSTSSIDFLKLYNTDGTQKADA
jgi:hypothetical protein